jgi:hypothetical protein
MSFATIFGRVSAIYLLRRIDTQAGVLSSTTDRQVAILAFTKSELANQYIAAKHRDAEWEAMEFCEADAAENFRATLNRGDATDIAIDPTPDGTAGQFRVFPLFQVLVELESS